LVVQNGTFVFENFELETVILVFKMLGKPGEVRCNALELVSSAPAPHAFAALSSACPVVKISAPIAYAP
jgi:hypothetical protein